MTRRDYILVCPRLVQLVSGFHVDYSAVFSTHHILKLELKPGRRVTMVDELTTWTGLDEALKAKAVEDNKEASDKEVKDCRLRMYDAIMKVRMGIYDQYDKQLIECDKMYGKPSLELEFKEND